MLGNKRGERMKKIVPIMMIMLFGLALPQADARETVPSKHARQKGIVKCKHLVDDIANFVLRKHAHGSIGTWNKKDPDNRLFSSMMSLEFTNSHAIATMHVAPNAAGSCDGSYTRVVYLDKSCATARETTYKEWKDSGTLRGLTVLENQSGAVVKILLPAGNGCVAVTNEIIYR